MFIPLIGIVEAFNCNLTGCFKYHLPTKKISDSFEDVVHLANDSPCRVGDGMYNELWRLCAGPLMDVPSCGERVFYFPQGHVELLQEPGDQEISQENPKFNLPSKILCRVIDIEFLAEKETDEVYACITLLPQLDQIESRFPDPICSEAPKQKFYSFCKTLSPSDTSTHGGCSILRKHATECLPQLDLTQENPTQELVAKDIQEVEWKFKHIYRGHPRRHLLTTGWGSFVTSKRLHAGDTFIFLRGENGQLRVGVRRMAWLPSPMTSAVVSIENMRLGVLATASHSVKSNTVFKVYYKPRTTQFIVGLNKYLEAMNNEFMVGMRFKMRHEGEDSLDRRFCGTIVGVGDESPEWPNSQWRSLKVQWDEPTTFQRAERVCCWEIEPFVASALNIIQPVVNCKRSRHAEASSSGSKENHVACPLRQKDNNSNPINTNSSSSRAVAEGTWHFLHLNANSNSFPDPKNDKAVAAQSSRPSNGKRTEHAKNSWLFGVNLTNISSNITPLEKEQGNGPRESSFLSACETGRVQAPNDHLLSNKGQQNQTIAGNGWQTKQAPMPSKRTRTKVKMQGAAVGRALDLTTISGYDELIDELEKLFDIKGELRSQNKWAVTFTDDENDMMLVGDDPWQEFCNIVKRIFICSRKGLMKLKCKRAASSSEVEEALLSHCE